MKKVYLIVALVIIASVFVSCSSKANVSISDSIEEQLLRSGTEDSNYVELTKVKNNIWVHTTYADYNGNRTSSNGLVIDTSGGLVLIDTPWNNEQTKELIKLTKSKFNKDISLALITHAHDDRIGGISALLENRIDVRSTSLTAQLAEKNGFKKPAPLLDSDPSIKVGDVSFEVFYPGEGHSSDNIVVWIPQYKVIFGGCLIKAMDSKGLGSTTDVNIEQWPISVKKILEKYPDADVVIPGHGKWGGIELLKHTLELLNR
ncbi:MAG TPA: subclass B1 metallo-beta-lactamase [Clostridia bacterium]|nr:subclass B1 metallo-beta-lactamase [Clostridia bacterium]